MVLQRTFGRSTPFRSRFIAAITNVVLRLMVFCWQFYYFFGPWPWTLGCIRKPFALEIKDDVQKQVQFAHVSLLSSCLQMTWLGEDHKLQSLDKTVYEFHVVCSSLNFFQNVIEIVLVLLSNWVIGLGYFLYVVQSQFLLIEWRMLCKFNGLGQGRLRHELFSEDLSVAIPLNLDECLQGNKGVPLSNIQVSPDEVCQH